MRAVVLALVLLAASGCGQPSRDPPGDQGLAGLVAEQVKAGRVVDLATLAPFAWDQLHLFGPYINEEIAEQGTGLDWPDRWEWSAVQWQDDRVFFVFLREGEVVSAFDYSRGDGDFVAPSAPPLPVGGFSPEAARFIVLDRGDGFAMLVPEAATRSEGGE